VVLDYVLGEMKEELFVELMVMMGGGNGTKNKRLTTMATM